MHANILNLTALVLAPHPLDSVAPADANHLSPAQDFFLGHGVFQTSPKPGWDPSLAPKILNPALTTELVFALQR